MNHKDLEGARVVLHLLNDTITGHKIQLFHSDYVLKLLLLFRNGSSIHIFSCLIFIAYLNVSQHLVNIFSLLCSSEIKKYFV